MGGVRSEPNETLLFPELVRYEDFANTYACDSVHSLHTISPSPVFFPFSRFFTIMFRRLLLIASVALVPTRLWQAYAYVLPMLNLSVGKSRVNVSTRNYFMARFKAEKTQTLVDESASKSNVLNDSIIGTVAILIPSVDADIALSKYGVKSPVGNPSIREAAAQLANKIQWFSEGTVKATVVPAASNDDQSFQDLKSVNAVIALSLSSSEDISFARDLFQARQDLERNHPQNNRQCQFGLDCVYKDGGSPLPVVVGPYKQERPSWQRVIPWTAHATGLRLKHQMLGLFERYTSDDFAVAILLFLNQFSGHEIDWVKYSIDATWEKGPLQNAKEFYSMITKCGDCIGKCVSDENCKTCLAELTAVDTRDQVLSYRTIVSFESDLLKDFSYCILQKNNIFNCKATIPTIPVVEPISSWRGLPLTTDAARALLVGHLKDDDAAQGSLGLDSSWRVACGANVAYDQFPSQNQIFYGSANGKDLWYDPVFRVETIDGRNVWCKRHYKVRNGPKTGTFRFSVLDNGITSNEFWTIVGVSDDLSWIVFHYAGAASAVGQRYLGGLLCTPDGQLPAEEQLPRVWDTFRRAGIQPWELYVVDNNEDSPGAKEAGLPPLTYFREEVMALKARIGIKAAVA